MLFLQPYLVQGDILAVQDVKSIIGQREIQSIRDIVMRVEMVCRICKEINFRFLSYHSPEHQLRNDTV